MADQTRRTRERVDADGVRIVETGVRREVWLLVLAVALVGLAVFVIVRPALQARFAERAEPASDPVTSRPGSPPKAVRPPAKPVPPPEARAVPPRVPAAEAESDVVTELPAGEAGAVDVAAAEGDPPTGIAVFPPPGTDPPKPGIIVPDDFELPPGYVRHHQVTDDGQMLPPILMFHPDYQPTDERGEPIALPADRVVPPDLAPPGMPVQILEVPDTQVPFVEFPEEQGKQGAAR